MSHYRYDIAEQALDQFGYSFDRTAHFTKAYHYFKWLVSGMPYVEYGVKEADPETMSWVWQDVQVAFVGHGSIVLTGAVLDLWAGVGNDASLWERTVYKAFADADVSTDNSVLRRYDPKIRMKPIRRPDLGFDATMVKPWHGPVVNPRGNKPQVIIAPEVKSKLTSDNLASNSNNKGDK